MTEITADIPKQLSSELPRLQLDGSIARVTLRRPRHQNRLQDEDLSSLLGHFARVNEDLSVRVMVIDAEVRADKEVFSAGYHIGEFTSASDKPNFEDVMNALEAMRPVTICALNGSVYGGATDIPLACDIVIAADDIQMQMPAARLGLHYYPQGLRRYVSRIGLRASKLAFLTARPIGAAAMLEMEYVHELSSRSMLADRVEGIAAEVADLAPLAVQLLKRSLNEIARGTADDAVLAGRAAASMASADFAEGRRAFAEKRKPVWTGK